jgi:hypothetical protein
VTYYRVANKETRRMSHLLYELVGAADIKPLGAAVGSGKRVE